MTHTVAVERQGPVGLVTLARPERHNAFDDALIAELTDALRAMEAEEGVRVVVLSSVGKSFSAGADLNWMRRMASASLEENRNDAMSCTSPRRQASEASMASAVRK
jgi:methylglutaconyl-CoA hydratase